MLYCLVEPTDFDGTVEEIFVDTESTSSFDILERSLMGTAVLLVCIRSASTKYHCLNPSLPLIPLRCNLSLSEDSFLSDVTVDHMHCHTTT